MEKVKVCIKEMLFFLMSKLPIQKKIVFCNFNGRGFGDDPKYITQELLSRNTSAKLVWLTDAPKEGFPCEVEVVRYNSILAKYHFFTSRIWVLNTKNVNHPIKRKGQYYIQTWHGGVFSLKKVEKAVENIPEYAKYVEMSKRDSTMIDLMYSDNDYVKEDYGRNFWYDGEVVKCGVPRESILVNTPKNVPVHVRQKYNIPSGTKIVLYAPTFRGDFSMNAYRWNYNHVLDEMESKIGCPLIMLLRMHPNVAKESDDFVDTERVRNASLYPDMQDLLAAADVYISDYSSASFEFACLRRKPVFLIGLDYEEYTRKERSFHLSWEELPFGVCKSEEELCDAVRNFSDECYQKKLDAFCELIGLEEDGMGASKLVDIIESKLR